MLLFQKTWHRRLRGSGLGDCRDESLGLPGLWVLGVGF